MRWGALVAGVFALVGTLLVATPAQPAEALSGSDFDPGYIISDGEFYNASAMNESQVQSFLRSKVVCQNNNCLVNYKQNTQNRASDAMCRGYTGASNEPAARIIAKVQASCGVSAKAIIVTLQKEQGLITSGAPSSLVLRKAMGYGCPDTAACDSTYYGFFNQVYEAARQLKRYTLGPPNNVSHRWIALGSPTALRLHPNASCGTKRVTVRNIATAALYYYTPYTPNPAALANLNGTGDGCSSYGNRNFWRFYNSWFGNPTEVKPAGVSITRLGGANRHEVSARASASVFPAGTPVAYVAIGSGFADALSAGSAAA
ncbi:MAG: cell wall-binding repeat-containing protein, partial [Microbacteriaceae bacterium]